MLANFPLSILFQLFDVRAVFFILFLFLFFFHYFFGFFFLFSFWIFLWNVMRNLILLSSSLYSRVNSWWRSWWYWWWAFHLLFCSLRISNVQLLEDEKLSSLIWIVGTKTSLLSVVLHPLWRTFSSQSVPIESCYMQSFKVPGPQNFTLCSRGGWSSFITWRLYLRDQRLSRKTRSKNTTSEMGC